MGKVTKTILFDGFHHHRPLTANAVEYLSLDFSNWPNKLSQQIWRWSVLPLKSSSSDRKREIGSVSMGSLELPGFCFQWTVGVLSSATTRWLWSWRNWSSRLSKRGARPASALRIWPQVLCCCGLGCTENRSEGSQVPRMLCCTVLQWQLLCPRKWG